ncbi:MAG TPA: ABC transporter transmembrane domain-containing protein [Casimicrobiaceae bacterium]|nr:ABC transporter transmembrane domain-containing protein [Casimicrobiaceae bacterium]
MEPSPSAPPRQPIARTLKRLVPLLAPYRARFTIAGVALLIAAGCSLAVGQGLKLVIDRGFNAGNGAELDRALFALLAIIAVMAVATYLRFYNVSWIGERVTADLRQRVFNHLLTLSPGFFEVTRTGEVISRLTNDTAMLDNVIGSSLSMALRNIVLGAGALVLLMLTSLKLTLLVLAGLPVVVLPIIVFGRRVRRLSRTSQDRLADTGAYVDEAIHEIRTVQAYAHEPLDRRAYGERVEAAFGAGVHRIRQRALLIAAVIFLVFVAVGIILWIGGHDVLAGRLSAGQLASFVFYAVIVATSVGAVSEVAGELQRAAGATERLMELLDTAADIAAPAIPLPLPEPPLATVALDAVTFAYPSRGTDPALTGLTLRVAAGERVALVGPSGAGKTTLFQLLLRFYDPQQGRVLIDGVDVRRADPRAVRGRIAVVPQEPVIFAASVWDNVRYGRPEASDAEVRDACEAAYATEFLARLPRGFDTDLGERGIKLSGGQRQRLAIARAVLSRRPILLLDEATSALDAESERMVQLALDRLMRGRTTLIIAHRLATVIGADRIVVLDGGIVVAEGTHRSLVRDDPLYRRLAALQFGSGAGDAASAIAVAARG